MSRLIRVAAVALVAALTSPAPRAQTDPGINSRGFRPTIERDSSVARVASFEYKGPVAYVRIEARESGSAPNEHPYAVDAATLRTALESLQVPGEKLKPLMLPAELDEIVAPLATALGHASADQDVCFAVSGRHGNLGPLTPRTVTTARVFRSGGKLNVIFGLVRHDWDSEYHTNGIVIPFEPGHRSGPLKNEPQVAPVGDFGAVHGSNWLVLDLDAVTAPALAAPASAPAPQRAAAASPTTPAAAAAPAPAAIAAPNTVAPASSSGRLYDTTAERLRALQRLRDDGLITQQEFEQKRREILDKL